MEIEKVSSSSHEKVSEDSQHEVYATVVSAASPPLPEFVPHQYGNPGPLGLISFGSTTLLLALYSLHVGGITNNNLVIGMALSCGGLAQLLAGMWEFFLGNVFGATTFISSASFWITYALVLIPSFNIQVAYTEENGTLDQFEQTKGVFLTVWLIVTFLFLLAALRSNYALIALFANLFMTFLLFMIASYIGNDLFRQAGSGFGIATSLLAYYIAASQLINPDTSYWTIHLGDMPKRQISPV